MSKTVAFHTLGCKLNYSETSALGRMMEGEGYVKKDFEEGADVYVINTCSVTENADKECRLLVRRIQKRAPGAKVVVTGCYAQLKPEEIAKIEGVDLVLGAAEKFNLAGHLKELTEHRADDGMAKICSCDIDEVNNFHSSFSQSERTRSFLKVQDGCDYNCSFCTIPLARGKSRSDSMEGVLRNVQELAKSGIQEIVLTGINLGDFGKGYAGDAKAEGSFYRLLCELEKADGVKRYRISSIEPNLLNNSIIELVTSSNKLMPHFHIPLQSGSNKILGKMRRRYKRELYEERVTYIKKMMPHCCIGVDIIVGFPSESDEDFKETFDFLHGLDVSYLHVFTYSERANTHALEIQQVVPMHVRHERNKILRNLSHQKMQFFTEQHRGQVRDVLFERAEINGMMEGYSDNYIKVQAPYRADWVNRIVEWVV